MLACRNVVFTMPCPCCPMFLFDRRGVTLAPPRSSSTCRHPRHLQPILPQPQSQPHPVPVAQGLDNTWEYVIEEADIPECAGILLDACVQTSRPALPNSFMGIEFVGTFVE